MKVIAREGTDKTIKTLATYVFENSIFSSYQISTDYNDYRNVENFSISFEKLTSKYG